MKRKYTNIYPDIDMSDVRASLYKHAGTVSWWHKSPNSPLKKIDWGKVPKIVVRYANTRLITKKK